MYTGLREEFKASRSKTKEKLVEYMENGAGVKVTEFHEKHKAFRACVSSKHCVSHSVASDHGKLYISQLVHS